jgi:hypothetical protein
MLESCLHTARVVPFECQAKRSLNFRTVRLQKGIFSEPTPALLGVDIAMTHNRSGTKLVRRTRVYAKAQMRRLGSDELRVA